MARLDEKLDREAIRIVALTRHLTAETGLTRVCPEAYGVAIFAFGPNTATRAVESFSGNVNALLSACRDALQARTANFPTTPGGYFSVGFDGSCRRMAQAAERYRLMTGALHIGVLHMLLAVLGTSREMATAFDAAGVGRPTLLGFVRRRVKPQRPTVCPRTGTKADPTHHLEETPSHASDPLAEFCVDLTAMAANGQLGPVIGRDREISRLSTTLCRQKKNNALLVGPEGAGKTAIVEALAQRIVAGNVPGQVAGRRIYAVDLVAIVAGTQYRGQFEERLKALLDAARQRREVILFIDKAHTMLGAGGALGSLDAANIMKPALARAEICCIAATTEAEYHRYFRKDKALDRRFQRIPVDEPTPERTIAVLKGLRSSLERHHHCPISDAAIEAAVELSGRHITDRFFPDKAIDVLDEMAARFAREGQPLGPEHAGRTVADQMGVPVETVLPVDPQRGQRIRDELQQLVVGQPSVIETVTRAVQRAFSPLRDPQRPLASLVFGGPSSVGKSYVAQIVSRQLYANTPLIHLNMAEYTEKHNVSRLLGAPPGYIGHGDPNQLTDRVRRCPHSLILIDNLDKAHPEVLHVLMELLEAGVLTDGEGNEASFRSAFIAMTTIAGSAEAATSSLGFGRRAAIEPPDDTRHRLRDACRKLFGEEFVNRVDAFVPFAPLGLAELRCVAAFAIEEINQRLRAIGRIVRCDGGVLDRLACTAANARTLRAAVRSEIEPLICNALAREKAKVIRVGLRDGRYALTYIYGGRSCRKS
jgi:ATP-dependent Clp protease ATP-binding subunit ClpC